jgi:ribosomal protein S2
MASRQLEDARMARKRHTAEEIVAKLRQVDVLTAQGRPVAEAVRAIGVTEVTYYRWRREFGGLKSDQVKRLKDLEAMSTDGTFERMTKREALSLKRELAKLSQAPSTSVASVASPMPCGMKVAQMPNIGPWSRAG